MGCQFAYTTRKSTDSGRRIEGRRGYRKLNPELVREGRGGWRASRH